MRLYGGHTLTASAARLPGPLNPTASVRKPRASSRRAARLGYNVLAVDMDLFFFHNPYTFLKSQLFRWARPGGPVF